MYQRYEISTYALHQGTAVSFSVTNPLADRKNQDSFTVFSINTNTDILVVADGAGGLPAGDKASSLAVSTLQKCVTENTSGGDTRTQIMSAIDEANNAILNLNNGSGTTLSVIIIQNGYYQHFMIGDSAAICVGQKGKIKYQAVGQGPVAFAEEAGLLSEKEALFHEDRHFISNLVGTREMYTTVTQPRKLAVKDRMLIASDGIWDNFYQDEIVQIIRTGKLGSCAETLAEGVCTRMYNQDSTFPGKADDATFILYQLSQFKEKK